MGGSIIELTFRKRDYLFLRITPKNKTSSSFSVEREILVISIDLLIF